MEHFRHISSSVSSQILISSFWAQTIILLEYLILLKYRIFPLSSYIDWIIGLFMLYREKSPIKTQSSHIRWPLEKPVWRFKSPLWATLCVRGSYNGPLWPYNTPPEVAIFLHLRLVLVIIPPWRRCFGGSGRWRLLVEEDFDFRCSIIGPLGTFVGPIGWPKEDF